MPVPSMRGAFGWVGQVAQDDLPANGEYNPNGMTWHKVAAGSFALADDHRPYEFEVGGSLLPPGTYKSSYWGAGQLSMRPRLYVNNAVKANGILPLLWSFAGSGALVDSTTLISTTNTLPASVLGTATTVADITGITGDAFFFPGASGSTQFGYDRGDGDNRYLTVRKLTPTSTGFIGETFYNARVASIRLASASTGPLTMDVAMMACGGDSNTFDQYVLEAITGEPTGANGWAYTGSADVTTIPMASGGYVKRGTLSSTELSGVRNLQIDLGGNMTPPQSQTVIGQYAPIGYSILSRNISVSFEFLWTNADLYRELKLGGPTGTAWSPEASTTPFWAKFPDAGGNNAIGFFAQSVHWMAQPIELRPESQVLMRVAGVVADASLADWGIWVAGADYGTVAWPT